jgi:hypothetical protein
MICALASAKREKKKKKQNKCEESWTGGDNEIEPASQDVTARFNSI